MASALSMTEVRKRLTAFSHKFKDAANEQQQATIFWADFYNCFGENAASTVLSCKLA